MQIAELTIFKGEQAAHNLNTLSKFGN